MPSDFQQLGQYLWVKQNNPYATNTGAVICGEQACLVDPGISPADCAEITDFVASHRTVVKTVILTHAHWDHLLGAQHFPGAQVVAHTRYHDVLQNHSEQLIQQASEWWLSELAQPLSSWVPPQPSMSFTKEMDIFLGDTSLRLYHAPGHTVDHTAVYIPQEKILWVGDMLSDRELPLVEDIIAYRQTLSLFEKVDVDVVVPGHGTPAVQPDEIQTRFDQDRIYVDALCNCVKDARSQGHDLTQTVSACYEVPFTQPDTYPNAHRWNIESAYLRLGGYSARLSGWENEWVTIGSIPRLPNDDSLIRLQHV